MNDTATPVRRSFDHGRRRQLIVASLLADVFQGRLRAGQHLVTQQLAERFGVSHTPVREALVAVAGLGFVDLHPNRGAVVRAVSPRDVREVCQVRKLLECKAVRLACGRFDPAELSSLRAGLTAQLGAVELPDDADPGPFLAAARDLDARLHDGIAASCGNAFLAQELGRLKTLFRAIRDVAWAHDEARHDWRRLTVESHEHLAIVEALAAGDPAAASRAMAHHIVTGGAYWARVIRDGQNPPAGPRPGPAEERTPAATGRGESRGAARPEPGPTPARPARRGENRR